jgi:hypothetical protein
MVTNRSLTVNTTCRGVSAVRGADDPLDELRCIYAHSDAASIVVLQGPKLLQKRLQDATVQHPNVMESTQSPFGLANYQYGPLKTIILMHREKYSQQDLDRMMKEPPFKFIFGTIYIVVTTTRHGYDIYKYYYFSKVHPYRLGNHCVHVWYYRSSQGGYVDPW